jgi:hypothetical protein
MGGSEAAKIHMLRASSVTTWLVTLVVAILVAATAAPPAAAVPAAVDQYIELDPGDPPSSEEDTGGAGGGGETETVLAPSYGSPPHGPDTTAAPEPAQGGAGETGAELTAPGSAAPGSQPAPESASSPARAQRPGVLEESGTTILGYPLTPLPAAVLLALGLSIAAAQVLGRGPVRRHGSSESS